MDSEHLYARTFRDASDSDAIAMRVIRAGSDLQRDRHIDSADDGVENVAHERFISEQR